MSSRNEENRKRIAQIMRDLPIAVAYVYERDRKVGDICQEYDLPKFGELEVLERLGLTTDRAPLRRRDSGTGPTGDTEQ